MLNRSSHGNSLRQWESYWTDVVARAASFPRKRRCFRVAPSRLVRLHSVFEELAREHLMELASERDDAGDPEHLSSEAEGQFRDRRVAAMESPRASRAPTRKPAQLSAEVLVRRFLRGLRNAPPSAAN